jgi:hypothetical protein
MIAHRPSPTVIPAKAGTHLLSQRTTWIPACAGMTDSAERTTA